MTCERRGYEHLDVDNPSRLCLPPLLCSVMKPNIRIVLTAIAFLSAASPPPSVGGQAPIPIAPGAVAQASRLRDLGDLSGAVRLLRAHLTEHPGDGDAARLLAQTLYWLKDTPAAIATYNAALSRNPHDTAAMLDYGRLLVETRRDASALRILLPLRNAESSRARAANLLAMLAYWQGNLTEAEKNFRLAVESDSLQHDARRQLGEILTASAPWLSVTTHGFRDDQPVDRLGIAVEMGRFLNPLVSISTRFDPVQYRTDEVGTVRTVGAEAELSHYAPSPRIETRVTAGFITRDFATTTTDWVGRLRFRVRFPGHTFAEVSGERAPYLNTSSSLVTPVMVKSVTAVAGLDHPRGWLGQAAVQLERYADSNSQRNAYIWLLAPIARSGRTELNLGYSLSFQDTDTTRFVLAVPVQRIPPADPAYRTDGRYVPYYTPENIRSHSVVASAALRPSASASIRLNGAYGVRARQDLPVFRPVAGAVPGGSGIRLEFGRHSFSPWNARLTFENGLSRDFSILTHADHMKTAFYSASTVGFRLNYRFTSAALRRVSRL